MTSFADLCDSTIEKGRYETLKATLREFRPLFLGKTVLDFGSSAGLSICALMELAGERVVGVEPDRGRVDRGRAIIERLGLSAALHHLPDTSRLPFPDGEFEVVLANAVFEHIPQPREPYVRELWRGVEANGVLIVNETPNKYLPFGFHTTGLWFVPWLPKSLARRYALWRGKWDEEKDWGSSGWRGLGYYELTQALWGFKLITPCSRPRHRMLRSLGLPSELFDPYPTLILKKVGAGPRS